MGFNPCRFDKGWEAGPIGNGLPVLMAAHIIIRLGLLGQFAQAVNVPLSARLANNEPFPRFAFDTQDCPFLILIGGA